MEVVGFQCEGSDDRISEFELKLMQIESEHMEIPEQPKPRQMRKCNAFQACKDRRPSS